MSKEVAMEGHGPGVLGTVKVRVSVVWKCPVSLVKPGSSLGFSLTSGIPVTPFLYVKLWVT